MQISNRIARWKVIASVAAAACLLVSCTSDAGESSDDTTTEQGEAAVSATKPEVTVPDGTPPESLEVNDLVVGEGKEAVNGDTVTVHYVGKSWSNKQQFDASWDNGQPFSFPLGGGRVIKGWDEGVLGMKEGGRRELVIPPSKGYGARGAGGVIGPNETLVFVVDLISTGK